MGAWGGSGGGKGVRVGWGGGWGIFLGILGNRYFESTNQNFTVGLKENNFEIMMNAPAQYLRKFNFHVFAQVLPNTFKSKLSVTTEYIGTPPSY